MICNYAMILAGGTGKRMGGELPKQFLDVDGTPVIVYTIEHFQRNEQIEKIIVVCIEKWIAYLEKLIKKYGLTKVEWIVTGGETSHDSIRNGVFFLRDKIQMEDYIVIHDAVRPILPQKAIDEVLRVAHEKGNACSSVICHAPIVYTEDLQSGITDIDREHVMLTVSPQAFLYSQAMRCYARAEEEGFHNATFTSSLLIRYGERVYFAKGTTCNIKITRREDIALFQALRKMPESELFSAE